jgi:hypothetical protein
VSPFPIRLGSTWLVILQCPKCPAQMACSGIIDPSELPSGFFGNVDVVQAVAALRRHALNCEGEKPPTAPDGDA